MTVFTLQPFAQPHPDITITGTLARDRDQLAIAYRVSGNLSQVILPPQSSPPTRQYNLWETTCFELFLGQPHQSPYWEFNLSPAGNWNIFQLVAYRQGLQEMAGISRLPFQVHHQQSSFVLSFTFDLNLLMSSPPTLDVGICAVIQSPHLPLTYWALCHNGLEADFHRRDGFTLAL